MRIGLVLGLALLLCGCGTPYGLQGSTGGVKIWEHPSGRIEIIAVGGHYNTYEEVVKMWRVKAGEEAIKRGVKSYKVVTFSTGREVLGFEVMGEGSNIERYSDEMPFWAPRIARGVIELLPASSGR
jgi:hypothetical protein